MSEALCSPVRDSSEAEEEAVAWLYPATPAAPYLGLCMSPLQPSPLLQPRDNPGPAGGQMAALGGCTAGLMEQAGMLAQVSCGFGNSFESAVLSPSGQVCCNILSIFHRKVPSGESLPKAPPTAGGEGWGRGRQIAEVSSLLLQALFPSLQKKKLCIVIQCR